jgi:hypothetical protein
VLAKGLVLVIDGGALRAQRASAADLLDSAGRAIGNGLGGGDTDLILGRAGNAAD